MWFGQHLQKFIEQNDINFKTNTKETLTSFFLDLLLLTFRFLLLTPVPAAFLPLAEDDLLTFLRLPV